MPRSPHPDLDRTHLGRRHPSLRQRAPLLGHRALGLRPPRTSSGRWNGSSRRRPSLPRAAAAALLFDPRCRLFLRPAPPPLIWYEVPRPSSLPALICSSTSTAKVSATSSSSPSPGCAAPPLRSVRPPSASISRRLHEAGSSGQRS
ncbi:hypothetical protein BRADI_3g43306v3 [Brachypodium distachyon]|uniref:Uncharacterized protein n=1 Tax=Brachypodium distachyon TaxID=15368 RepID=A0A2K2D2V5_BRADI|nr:hypothetical protein BRADI_3g43306v3 [Brachypodium distachyon]